MFSKDYLSEEALYELNKIKEIEQKINIDDICILTLDDALEEQVNLENTMNEFKESMKSKILEKEEQKTQTLNNVIRLLRGRQEVLNGFDCKMFPIEKKLKSKY